MIEISPAKFYKIFFNDGLPRWRLIFNFITVDSKSAIEIRLWRDRC